MINKDEVISTIIGGTLVICFVFLIGFVAVSLVNKTAKEVEKTRMGQKIAYWLSEPNDLEDIK